MCKKHLYKSHIMCYTKDSNFLDSFLISSFLVFGPICPYPELKLPGIFLPFFKNAQGIHPKNEKAYEKLTFLPYIIKKF